MLYYLKSWMDKEAETKDQSSNLQSNQQVVPQKIEKVTHFHQQIVLPPEATIVPYRPQHTSDSKKSKKSKRKFEEFQYYRYSDDKAKIMKVLFKDEEKYMVLGNYPFLDPLDEIEKVADMPAKNVLKVIKSQAAYIGHFDDKLVIKKMTEVKLGQEGNEFDTIGDNFEVIDIANKERFEQFLRILKTHPKALQMSIRVIIDESVIGQPKVMDYEFFKRQTQIKTANNKFIQAK